MDSTARTADEAAFKSQLINSWFFNLRVTGMSFYSCLFAVFRNQTFKTILLWTIKIPCFQVAACLSSGVLYNGEFTVNKQTLRPFKTLKGELWDMGVACPVADGKTGNGGKTSQISSKVLCSHEEFQMFLHGNMSQKCGDAARHIRINGQKSFKKDFTGITKLVPKMPKMKYKLQL